MAVWLEIVGIVLFALAILVSVSLHEAGHMVTAKAFGMKVTRYFVGFGPTLWSFKRGETEYGIKGIPLGGFCKIVGMTPQDDDVAPEDEPRAMWRFPVWKRTIVMAAGSATHFLLAIVAPLARRDLHRACPTRRSGRRRRGRPQPAVVAVADCVQLGRRRRRALPAGDPAEPGRRPPACRTGDQITAVNGTPVATYGRHDRRRPRDPAGPRRPVTYDRDGQTQRRRPSTWSPSQRAPLDNPSGPVSTGRGGRRRPRGRPYPAWSSTARSTRSARPATSPATWPSQTVAGDQADPGEGAGAVDGDHRRRARPEHPDQRGRRQPARRRGDRRRRCGELFLMLFISLNFFIGMFNLLPLLPLDGGHIAIAWFERARSWIYAPAAAGPTRAASTTTSSCRSPTRSS